MLFPIWPCALPNHTGFRVSRRLGQMKQLSGGRGPSPSFFCQRSQAMRTVYHFTRASTHVRGVLIRVRFGCRWSDCRASPRRQPKARYNLKKCLRCLRFSIGHLDMIVVDGRYSLLWSHTYMKHVRTWYISFSRQTRQARSLFKYKLHSSSDTNTSVACKLQLSCPKRC